MRRIVPIAFFAAFAVLVRGEVLDRLAVSIDNDVITEYQVVQQLRLAAFENHEPVDLGGQQKRRAAEQLVERRLIEREMQLNRYPGPDDSLVAAEMIKLITGFGSEVAYRQALAKSGLSEDDVRQFERAQLATLRFIALRFRPAIQVGEDELREYYQNEFVPNWQKQKPQVPPPALAEVREQLEESITRMRESQALDRWLGETRRQTEMRWQQEVFQ